MAEGWLAGRRREKLREGRGSAGLPCMNDGRGRMGMGRESGESERKIKEHVVYMSLGESVNMHGFIRVSVYNARTWLVHEHIKVIYEHIRERKSDPRRY